MSWKDTQRIDEFIHRLRIAKISTERWKVLLSSCKSMWNTQERTQQSSTMFGMDFSFFFSVLLTFFLWKWTNSTLFFLFFFIIVIIIMKSAFSRFNIIFISLKPKYKMRKKNKVKKGEKKEAWMLRRQTHKHKRSFSLKQNERGVK